MVKMTNTTDRWNVVQEYLGKVTENWSSRDSEPIFRLLKEIKKIAGQKQY